MTPTPLSEAEERAIRERLAKATPGRWVRIGPMGAYSGTVYEVRTPDAEPKNEHYWPFRICRTVVGQTAAVDEHNFDFIAHAPADIQALLSELSRLQSENLRLKTAMEESLRGEIPSQGKGVRG